MKKKPILTVIVLFLLLICIPRPASAASTVTMKVVAKHTAFGSNGKELYSITYTYNKDGLISQSVDRVGTSTATTYFTYNSAGRISSIKYPTSSYRLTYRSDGRLDKVQEYRRGRLYLTATMHYHGNSKLAYECTIGSSSSETYKWKNGYLSEYEHTISKYPMSYSAYASGKKRRLSNYNKLKYKFQGKYKILCYSDGKLLREYTLKAVKVKKAYKKTALMQKYIAYEGHMNGYFLKQYLN